MSVLVKMHHTEIEIRGEESQKVIDVLQKAFGNIVVDQTGSVDIATTDWHKKMEKNWTPAKEVRANRNKFLLNQENLGKKIGKTKQYISDIETGRRTVTIPVAKALGEVFNRNYHRFL